MRFIFINLPKIQMANVGQIISPLNKYCLQKMSNYYEESTNFTSNPLSNQRFFKQKLIDEPSHFEEDNSKTIAFHNIQTAVEDNTIKPGKLPKKIKSPLIDQNPQSVDYKTHEINQKQFHFLDQDTATKTRRIKPPIKKKILSEGVQQQIIFPLGHSSKNESKQICCEAQKKKIPEPCPQVQSILSGPKMREKYAHLLPKAHKKAISYEQQHLLKIFSMMDETIEFSTKNRATKFMFFEELRKIIRDSLRVFLEMRHLEQLLYLDENLYEVKWEWSYQKKGHDIMIVQPKIQSKDERKTRVRQVMIDFLNQKHRQFMLQKGKTLGKIDGSWHQDFEPGMYEIPRKPMPPHPETREAELRCFDENKIEGIKNTKLKELIQTKKLQSDVQSFKSKSVMDMIFSGVNSKNIETQILAAVKQREYNGKIAKVEEQQRIERQKTAIDPDILKEVSQTILLIYMSKSVSNLFKVKLNELVKERTNHKFGDFIVDRHIEHLIELKEIGYLKEIIAAASKPVIIQINKSKAKEIIAYTERMKQKIKEEEQQQEMNSSQSILMAN